jgi:hypothetical protein
MADVSSFDKVKNALHYKTHFFVYTLRRFLIGIFTALIAFTWVFKTPTAAAQPSLVSSAANSVTQALPHPAIHSAWLTSHQLTTHRLTKAYLGTSHLAFDQEK